jgi:hypothetical protein
MGQRARIKRRNLLVCADADADADADAISGADAYLEAWSIYADADAKGYSIPCLCTGSK